MALAESAAGMPETISVAETALPEPRGTMDRRLRDELWRASAGPNWGLERDEFDRIVMVAGSAQNYGLESGVEATPLQQAAFLRGLRLDDLVLARACAAGNDRAWEHFIAQHRQPLIRAAIAITGSETLGRDLADQLYAELFGLNSREGERNCPLLSYRGRGSLMGWLRTTLAQRHVDHHRRCRREQQIEEIDLPAADASHQKPSAEISQLERAVARALLERDAEERFLLAAYYLDGRTLLEIARVLGVHEATVSRKLRRDRKSVVQGK